MPDDFPPGALKAALRSDQKQQKNQSALIPNCSVPVKTGTMLVFSNYQMAHRVLRMVNTSSHHASSRKFVALFIMDPAAERLVPASAHLAESYLFRRSLTGPSDSQASLPDVAANIIMEFLGIIPSLEERRHTRNLLLKFPNFPWKNLQTWPVVPAMAV